MTRFLLTWLGVTILQLGVPHGVRAGELRRADESTRVTPQLEALSTGALVRDGSVSGDHASTHAPPIAPVGSAWLSPTVPRGERAPRDRDRSPSIALAFLLPEARAPPA